MIPLRGGRIKYNGRAVNFSFGFGGVTLTHTVIELEDVVGIILSSENISSSDVRPTF